MKLIWTAFLVILAVVIAEPRVQPRRGLTVEANIDVAGKHPYLFWNVPRGRSGSAIQGFQVIEEKDDDDSVEIAHDDDDEDYDISQQGSFRAALSDDELDDDDDDSNYDDNDNDSDNANEEESPKKEKKNKKNVIQNMDKKKTMTIASNLQMILQNAKPTQMMVSKEHAGAIMVPDGIIEIEGQSVIDEKTGKAALLVPRSALEAIPDGSVVALMERSTDAETDEEEERANRVIVRRRRRGSRRNVRRHTNANGNRNGNRNQNRRRKVKVNGNRNNQRRRVNRRKNVQVIRPNTNNRRRQINRRRINRPVVYQI